jgi:hypothetical protein
MKQHNLKSFNGFEKTNRSVGHLFSFLLPQKFNWNTDVALAYNVLWLCVRWGFPALKPIDRTNFNLSTNDYR